jgi:hypothetical protein
MGRPALGCRRVVSLRVACPVVQPMVTGARFNARGRLYMAKRIPVLMGRAFQLAFTDRVCARAWRPRGDWLAAGRCWCPRFGAMPSRGR